MRIIGTDIYEWFADGRFLMHRVHVRVGDQPVEAIEFIGEPDDGAFTMRSFDNEGAVGVMRNSRRHRGGLRRRHRGARWRSLPTAKR